MKYVIGYETRTAGLTQEEHLQDGLLTAFSKWEPEDGLTVHAFVCNRPNGGYLLVEADDPKVVALLCNKFVYWNDVNVVPVVDVEEVVPVANAASAWAEGAVSSG